MTAVASILGPLLFLLALALALPSFVIKGIAVYLYLAVWLAWSEATARRLWIAATSGKEAQ